LNLAVLVLNILGIVLLVKWLIKTVKELRQSDKSIFSLTLDRLRHPFTIGVMMLAPYLIVNILIPSLQTDALRASLNEELIWLLSVMMAFLISAIWFMYVRRLDIYEQEKWGPLIIVFVLSCLSTEIVVMWLYDLSHVFITHNEAVNDSALTSLMYCIFVIGGIEEFGKMLPIIFVLYKYKNAINEPYDFILYGSVSALGFAFMENIMYINSSNLYNIGGRALYAAVAHMTFTSTICYGLMLVKFNFTKLSKYLVIPLFFGIAMFSHGFYDFWLITPSLYLFKGITTIFFLITIHIWFTMKNNAINVSNFFSPDISIKNEKLRFYLIISLVGLLMLAYIMIGLFYGQIYANEYLEFEILSYGYLVIYLAFGLSRYQIVKDEMNPFRIPFNLFIPKPLPGKSNKKKPVS